MKLKLSFLLLLLASVSLAQVPKAKQVHQFFEATLQSIKTADTTAFIILYEQATYLEAACCRNIDSIAASERRRLDFRTLCTNWQPYVNDLAFEIDCFEKNKKKVPDEEFGYEFTICLTSKAQPKAQKYRYIALSFIMKNEKLYCTSLVPFEILSETKTR